MKVNPRDSSEGAHAGGPAGFAHLVERYSGLVRRVIGRGVDSAAVDDVVQEVFVDAWRGLDSLREPEALKAWLVSLAIRRVQKWQRRRRVERDALPQLARRACAKPAVDMSWSDPVLHSLDELDPGMRTLVHLRFRDGLTAPEIATALGLSHDAVRKRLSRTLRTLRQSLILEALQ